MQEATVGQVAEITARQSFSPRLKRRLALALVLAGGLLLLVQYARPIGDRVVPLTEIVVRGGDVQSRELVEKQLAELRGDSLWHINLDLYKNLLEVLPGVEQAQLQRVLPNQLMVLLQASQPLARWNGIIIDSSGRAYPSDADQVLPVFRTDFQNLGKVAAFYRRVAGLLPDSNIVQVDFDRHIGWRVFLANGIMVHLGDEPEQRLQRYARYMDTLGSRLPPLHSVDMRYSQGFAVRLQEEEQ